MMKISEHFDSEEFECKTDPPTPIPENLMPNLKRLVEALEILRDKYFNNRPIYILSGYRTAEYNKKCGGSKKSKHMTMEAADIKVKGMFPTQIHARIEIAVDKKDVPEGGLGLYSKWVHYDIRAVKARWFGKK
jgi:uncharacterized protein YcbK (DUF882 family)